MVGGRGYHRILGSRPPRCGALTRLLTETGGMKSPTQDSQEGAALRGAENDYISKIVLKILENRPKLGASPIWCSDRPLVSGHW